jgi:hypothetical protein
VAFGGITFMKKVSLKSQTDRKAFILKFCLGLSTNLLIDMLQQAGLDFKRDVSTLRRRTHREGLGFLTKTLPSLGKEVIQALNGNRLTIRRFRKQHRTAIPHFMKGLLSRIFTPEGNVRDDAEICAITDVYQFCMLFYKLEVPYDSQTEGKVLDTFAKVDAELPKDFNHLGTADTRLEPNILREARGLVTRCLTGIDPLDIVPRHGPGAVATGEKPDQKMHLKRIYDSVEECYPASEYYFLNAKHLFDEWDSQYWSLDHVDEPQAKVMLVPKDSRGPRLISAEPLEVQFLQQGLGRKLVQRIERHPLTKGHVNFTDQTVNRKLALRGSVDGKWSTLDLKEASDRVSLALVKELFGGTGLLPNLLALRSKSTVLPDGRVVRMGKYAPMGSALCFPVEALCFWALAVACIHVCGQKSLKTALSSVYVYGDDIIVRGGDEKYLLQYFHYFGLRLNDGKCCYTGLFRESCGCDAYRGHVVTPIKVKRLPISARPKPAQKRYKGNVKAKSMAIPPIDGAHYAAWVSIGNLLFQKCYYRAADYVKKHVESVAGFVPLSERDPQRKIINPWEANSVFNQRPGETQGEPIIISDSAPCWYVRQVATTARDRALFYHTVPSGFRRYNPDLQRHEFRALQVQAITFFSCKRTKYHIPEYEFSGQWVPKRSSYRCDTCSDRRELFRHFIAELGTVPYQYAFLRRVKLKRKWTSLAY